MSSGAMRYRDVVGNLEAIEHAWGPSLPRSLYGSSLCSASFFASIRHLGGD
jgi:hypothetical protein